jgi:hypothetical protein
MPAPLRTWLRSFRRGTPREDPSECEDPLGWKAASELIDNLNLDKRDKTLVRTRWLCEAKRYEKLWARQRSAYYWLRVFIVTGAATVPVLAGLSVSKIATALVGLGVAILTGLDALFRLDSRWQQARLAAIAMSFEGWEFLELSGKEYKETNHREALKGFMRRLEELNERLSTRRLDLFKVEGREPPSEGGSN